MTNLTSNPSTVIYRCPHEGICKGNKHCFVLETDRKLLNPITVFLKCPIRAKKIQVEIG